MTASAGALASQVEDRNTEPNIRQVWERVVTFGVVSGDTTGAATLPINGILQKIIYKRPNTTNDNLTSTLVLTDNGDNQIFTTGAGLAENLTTAYSVTEPFATEINLAITFNEDVGVTATFTVTLRGI